MPARLLNTDPKALHQRSHMRRGLVLRVLGALAVAYALLCGYAAIFERRITFRANPHPVTPAEFSLTEVEHQTLATADGERLVVWRRAAATGRPTILYFQGNGDTLGYRAERMRQFGAQGWGVFMLAWRGFSGSTGEPTEANAVADARLAYATLRAEGIEAGDIVIYGESLGTNIATVVALTQEARALILEAPFTSMVDAWRQFAPFLPVGLMMRDRFDTLDVIGGLRRPLLVIHGERDRMVGHHLGRRLFEAAPAPKRHVGLPEAGHTDLYAHGAIDAVRRFLDDVAAGTVQ